jgi:acetyltransferase-like isoleucine patch superfamily enzyme
MSVDEVLKFYGKKNTFLTRLGYYIKYISRFFLERLSFFCVSYKARVGLHKLRGVNIGKDVYIGADVMIDRVFPDQIHIGDHSSVGDYSVITAHANIPMNTPVKKIYPRKISPVRIGKGVWMMPHVIIIPGVTIGDYAVIATGAVILNDIPPMVMAAGMPAIPKKDLKDSLKPFIPEEEFIRLIKIRKKMDYEEQK